MARAGLALLAVALAVLAAAPEASAQTLQASCRVEPLDCAPYGCLAVELEAVLPGTPLGGLVSFAAVGLEFELQRFSLSVVLMGLVDAGVGELAVGPWRIRYAGPAAEAPPWLAELALGGCGARRVGPAAYAPTTCRLVNVTVELTSRFPQPTVSLTLEGYGAPSLTRLLGALLGSARLYGHALDALRYLDLEAPIPLAAGWLAALRAGAAVTTLEVRLTLVYPAYLVEAVAAGLARAGCSVAADPLPPRLLALHPIVLRALEGVNMAAAEALREGRPALMLVRMAEMCAELREQPPAPGEAPALAALCALEPLDPYGIVFQVDMSAYTRLVALAAASHSNLTPLLALLESGEAGRAEAGVSPDLLPAGALPLLYHVVPLLGPVDPDLVVPPLPLTGARPPPPSEVVAQPLGGLAEGYAGVYAGAGAVAPEAEGPRAGAVGAGWAGGASAPGGAAWESLGPVAPVAVVEGELPRTREEAPSVWERLRRLVEELNATLAARLLERRAGIEAPPLVLTGAAAAPPHALAAYAAAAALAPLAYRAARLVRGLVAAARAGGDARACYAAMLRVLEGLGLGRRPEEGALEHAHRLPSRVRRAVAPVVEAYVGTVFGGRPRSVEGCLRACLAAAAGRIAELLAKALRVARR